MPETSADPTIPARDDAERQVPGASHEGRPDLLPTAAQWI